MDALMSLLAAPPIPRQPAQICLFVSLLPGVDTPPQRDGSGVGLTDCGYPFCSFDIFFLDKSQDARLTYSSQHPRVDPLFLCSITTTVTTGGQRIGRIFNLAKVFR